MKIFVVPERYETPYFKIAPRRLRNLRLAKYHYTPGFYKMFGVKGYDLFEVRKTIPVTCLEFKHRSRWETLMVDDPLHWYGMEEMAEFATGKTLVAGLGLGLILFHLVKRPVDLITVVEIDPLVVQLITPFIPIAGFTLLGYFIYGVLKETYPQVALIIFLVLIVIGLVLTFTIGFGLGGGGPTTW